MYSILIFLHLIGLVLGMGIPIANLVAQRLAASASPEGAAALRALPPRLAPFSQAGLALLVITGLLMLLSSRGRDMAFITGGFWFWVKMLSVAGLVAVVYFIWQTSNEIRAGNTAAAERMRMLGPAALALSLAATFFAVIAFT